jgi:hypothetical protein
MYKNEEIGVESSNFDYNEHKKSPGEIALENASNTGGRLMKKIKELELKFSNDHDENRKQVKKIGSKTKGFIIAKHKKAKVRRDPSNLLNLFYLFFMKFQHCSSILPPG